MIEDGNKATGGLNKVISAYGIVGFIKFLEGYYVVLITKRSAVALIGGHYIYHIDDTLLLPITNAGKSDRKADESRYINIFQNVDLSRNFYFSYTYDITHTLQHNMTRPPNWRNFSYNEMFVWNHYLLETGFRSLRSNSDWILPIIYGFVDQASVNVFGRNIFVTLIARRSRFFAGARFLKRGVNDQGYVANDVETEQIVHDMNTTSFHCPGGRLFNNPGYTSYTQHRGSIPLFWTQDTNSMAPKPPIEVKYRDPFFSAAALHFDNMHKRYGAPVIVLNLIKAKEKTKRESKLLDEYSQNIAYLNQFLPDDKKIQYIAWDMSRASKSPDQDVIGTLEKIAEDALRDTNFFHSGPEPYINFMKRQQEEPNTEADRIMSRRQNGVVRTNCIDCVDRTNAAQFVIGRCALAHQLYALGVIPEPFIPFDCDAVNMLTEMYHDHGNTIALQYGGSHLVNTMETYRKIKQWSSHSRDMIEALKRYYNNSFIDAEKQDSINLFLGNFIPERDGPMLWELQSDYYLHHEDPRYRGSRRNYIHWWSPDSLQKREDKEPDMSMYQLVRRPQQYDDDGDDPFRGYWIEYYRPRLFTSFANLFAYNMNSTLKMSFKDQVQKEVVNESDYSPFTVRASSQSTSLDRLNIGGFRRWLALKNPSTSPIQSKKEPNDSEDSNTVNKKSTSGKTTTELVSRLLHPEVANNETREYRRYVNQFKSNSAFMAPTPTAVEDEHLLTNHSDYPIYASYVGKSKVHPVEPHTSNSDLMLYTTYVEMPSEMLKSGGTRFTNPNIEKQRYDAYNTWLTVGKFKSKKKQIWENRS
ncbi:hypothetical protein K493DRAFT_29135 [Basidiobolus meristosporus CBS 931.73]|uniref:SAC domain-containing protein n=1 Tax=Basidiobolus meristosporus CBS 931.73 TaxID=1314790 RepID=A0A1Y1ZDK4_9FUNG|nr:hypothetical protein K493DRAFT_29135 [Basidiobolus meristosporus CBS 931.73]|eukprot:ORY08286.1 hypothetical protein K493DRAFT_29135 [Basidiobolus meristosporus CBS 931.73]